VIIDTSAIIAILRNEPDRQRFLDALNTATQCWVAAPTLFEASIVLSRFGPQLTNVLAEFVREAEISIVPFDHVQLSAAQEANRRFGKGSGHAARLNFGDCFAYAACAVSGQPLLFKGADFSQTDVVSVLAR
jgi:ribonuclease VapC